MTRLADVYAHCSGLEGSHVMLELQRRGLSYRLRLTRKPLRSEGGGGGGEFVGQEREARRGSAREGGVAGGPASLPYKREFDQLQRAGTQGGGRPSGITPLKVPGLGGAGSMMEEPGPPTARGVHCRSSR